MKTTWIVAADNSRASIFERIDRADSPRKIEDFDNPDGRAHNRDLVTDAGGRYFGKGDRTQGHTASGQESPVDHAGEMFAKRLAAHLEKARVEQRYDRLRLVAAPKFLGLLRQNLGKEVDKLVDEALARDVSWFDENSLAEYLRDKAT